MKILTFAFVSLFYFSTPTHAQEFTCMGFLPAEELVCHDNGVQYIVTLPESPNCVFVRDGLINGQTEIKEVNGPTFYSGVRGGSLTFIGPDGLEHSLSGCETRQ